jgi:hypothetical protein
MSAAELAACVLRRLERPTDAQSILMLSENIQKTFRPHRRGLVEFDRGTYPGRWKLNSTALQPDRKGANSHGIAVDTSR